MEDEGMWSLIMDPTPCHWDQWSLNAVSFFDRTQRRLRPLRPLMVREEEQ